MKGLIESEGIRFHIKKLVLQFLGQVEVPNAGEVEVVLGLVHKEEWRQHVIEDVLVGHEAWYDVVHAKGLMKRWLKDTEREIDNALHLIRTVIEDRGDSCRELLDALLLRGEEWSQRVADLLPMSPARDTDSLFELRLRLAAASAERCYVDWKDVGRGNLPRLLLLLRALLPLRDFRDSSGAGVASFHGLDEIDFSSSSTSVLADAWDSLVPAAAQAVGLHLEEEDSDLRSGGGDWRIFLRGFLRKLAAEICARDPILLMRGSSEEQGKKRDLLVVEALSQIHQAEVADQGLRWLMADPARLRQRWARWEIPWAASRGTVERLARICSMSALSSFECFLLELREPDFGRRMTCRHESLLSPPEGYRRFSCWILGEPSVAGQTAYHLLSALPPERISAEARLRLEELRRKFDKVDELYFAGSGRCQFGAVTSPLDPERVNRLSDKTWLGIIRANEEAIPEPRWPRTFRNGRFEAASAQNFAANLQAATAREPARFARLALRFPPEKAQPYLRAVIRGLRPERGRADQPSGGVATLGEMEAVILLPQVSLDNTAAIDVVRLVESRTDLDWGVATLQFLASIATTHPDPEPGAPGLRGSSGEDWGPQSLVDNALNCARGAAAIAMARLILAAPGRLRVFGEAIERVVEDPHPAVRAAALDCCLAVLEADPEHAIELALRAITGHEALLACSKFDRFLGYAAWRNVGLVDEALLRMLRSSRDDVVQTGAEHVVALYLLKGSFEEAALGCLRGSTAQRAGAAGVAAALADKPEQHRRAREFLRQLFNDDSDAVLEECARAFRGRNLDMYAESPDFLASFAASRAFKRDPLHLLHQLREYPGSLLPFAPCLLPICRSLADTLIADQHQRRHHWEANRYLPPILLRLYGQAPEESDIRDKCLDAWDILLRERVISASRLMNLLEVDEDD